MAETNNNNPWYKGWDNDTTKGQMLGIGSSMISDMMKAQDPEAQQWGINATGADNAINSAIGMIPGWGIAAVAGKKLLEGAASQAFDYNKYGVDEKGGDSSVKDLAYGFQSLMNPVGSITALNEQKEKTGKDLKWYDNLTGKNRKELQKTALGREDIANDMENMQKQFETSQQKINKSANLFANSTRDANRIWGNNTFVAKNGIEVPELKSYKEHYEFKPKEYYTVKPNVITFKEGGSIIPMGAYHHTNNNLGDKGLPVVESNGVKIFELERDELILDGDISREIKEEQYLYNTTGDKKHLIKIGNLMKEEILNNTHSPSPVYSCLNNGSCSIIN